MHPRRIIAFSFLITVLLGLLAFCPKLRAQAPSNLGGVYTQPFGSTATTYSAVASITAAASATDIAILPGNATNTVYLQRVTISGVQTTAGLVKVLLLKRSTANTVGTSTAMACIPHQAGDAAAVSAPLAYSANPTAGTSLGTVEGVYLPTGPAATATTNPTYTFEFGRTDKPIILSGVAQAIAVNLGGVTVTGGIFSVKFEWIEAIPSS